MDCQVNSKHKHDYPLSNHTSYARRKTAATHTEFPSTKHAL